MSSSEFILARDNRFELFTTGECETILGRFLKREGKSGKLLSFRVEAELGTVGFLGEYFHLYLRYRLEESNDEHQVRLFVKSIPYQNIGMTNFIETSGILKKEATLYDTLINKLAKISKRTFCATCFMVRKDLFVLENLVDLGYENLETSSGFLNEAQLKPILKGLATLHASSIAYEAKNDINIGRELKDTLFEVTVLPTVEWYVAGVRAVMAVALDHPGYKNNPKIGEFLRTQLPRIVDTVYGMVNPSHKYRNVFCHRDVWGGNVFYSKTDPLEIGCVFVDFQLCRYSPPAIDILMALYLNLRPLERKSIMDSCYQYYYQCFSQELADQSLDASKELSFDELQSSLKDLQLFGALYNCLTATILRVPENYLSDLKHHHPEAFHKYTNIDRTVEVLELVQNYPEFRQYMYECIEDLMELVLPQFEDN